MRGSIHAFATDERRPEHGGSLRLARRLRHGAMATNYALTHATATAELAPRLTVAEEVAKFVRTKPLGAAGAAIILAMMAVAGFAEPLAPYDPYRGDYGLQFARPSADHWFGTDEFGRDILSRIMYGARIALFVDRKSTRLNSSHLGISYAVFCLKKKRRGKRDDPSIADQ